MISPEARQYLKYAIAEGIVVVWLLWSQPRAPIKILPDDVAYGFAFIFAFVTLFAFILSVGEEVGKRF